MIVNTELSHDADYIGDIQENRVGIDKSNVGFITTLLTSNLYSRPLESFFRETVSNAYDSHVEAGTNEPILLLIEDTDKYATYRISIRDYGVGVSPERFEKIYRNIGSSTKRESNDFIGMFGIGRFSCLSCADVAHVTSYYQGTKYSYVMYKNGGGINIDQLSVTKGDYKNGLEVSVTVYTYNDKIEKALLGICLFDKVHVSYKGENSSVKSIVARYNHRTIVHYKTFSRCSLLWKYDNYFKVGKVLYEGTPEGLATRQGLIVDLPMGSVDITPNREALQYTAFTNDTIKTQVETVKQELQDIVNTTVGGDMSLQSFFEYFVDGNEYVVPSIIDEAQQVYGATNDDELQKALEPLRVNPADVQIDFSKTTIDGESLPSEYSSFLRNVAYYSIPPELIHKTLSPNRNRAIFRRDFRYLFLGRFVLINKEDKVTKQVTLRYTSDNLSSYGVILIYEGLVKLKDFIKGAIYGHKAGLVLDTLIDFTFKHLAIQSMSNDSVPQSYIDEYRDLQKSKKKKVDTQGLAIRRYVYDGYRISRLDHLPKEGLVLYTSHTKDDSNLRKLSDLLLRNESIAAVITVKKEAIKLLEGNKRFMTVEKFLIAKNKILTKYVTCAVIRKKFADIGSKVDNFKSLPIWRQFRKKYENELDMTDFAGYNSMSEEILKYYESRGWVNQADIDEYSLNAEEVGALTYWQNLETYKYKIVKFMAYKKYGKKPKIGLRYEPFKID